MVMRLDNEYPAVDRLKVKLDAAIMLLYVVFLCGIIQPLKACVGLKNSNIEFLNFLEFRRDPRQACLPNTRPRNPQPLVDDGAELSHARAFARGDRHDRYGHSAGLA